MKWCYITYKVLIYSFRTKANLGLQYGMAYIHDAIYWWKKSVHVIIQSFNFHPFGMYYMWISSFFLYFLNNLYNFCHANFFYLKPKVGVVPLR